MGNFSSFYSETAWTHNLVLEIISGLGIFSTIFIVWLFNVFKTFLHKDSPIPYEALFLAIFVNFTFDITYIIPTMLWLWFTAFALAPHQSKKTIGI